MVVRRLTAASVIMLILFLSLIFVPIPEDDLDHASKYVSTEKETYKVEEDVKINLVNDGGARVMPLVNYLTIEEVDTGRTVYRYEGMVLFMVPSKGRSENITWNQTDMQGEQVPSGEYEASFLGHSVRFEIGDVETEELEFQTFVRSIGVVGSLLTGFLIARDRFEDDGK